MQEFIQFLIHKNLISGKGSLQAILMTGEIQLSVLIQAYGEFLELKNSSVAQSSSQLQDLLPEDLKNKILLSVQKLGVVATEQQCKPEQLSALRECLLHFHQLSGVLRFAEIQAFDGLLSDVESHLVKAIDGHGKAPRSFPELKLLKRVVELIWRSQACSEQLRKVKSVADAPSAIQCRVEPVWLTGSEANQ